VLINTLRDKKVFQEIKKFPKNIWIIYAVQPLVQSIAPVLVFVGGLLGAVMAPDPSWATLPIAVMIVATALSTIPAVLAQKKFGRKRACMLGMSFALIATLVLTGATFFGKFSLLLLGASCIGVSQAFMLQLRFAIIESLDSPNKAPIALSFLMLAGLLGAVGGPEIALSTKDLIASEHGFVASFLVLGLMCLTGMLIFGFYKECDNANTDNHGDTRSVLDFFKQPAFVLAVIASGVGFAVMSYVMTATPISMHDMHGHSLRDTKWVIQSHLIAMLLPSLLTGALMQRFGSMPFLIAGTFAYSMVIVLALMGHSLMQYWWMMVVLGLGWNFLFLSGTAILPTTYHAHERFKAQGINDFVVFSLQALASLSAGLVLFTQGWDWLIYSCIPVVVIMSLVVLWYGAQGRQSIS